MARVVDAYLGNGGFKASLPRIMNDTGIKPYDLFHSLTEFIYSKGYGTRLHRKDQLARLLYAWATDLYYQFDDTLKLDILRDAVHADLEKELPEDAMIKFERAGWSIED